MQRKDEKFNAAGFLESFQNDVLSKITSLKPGSVEPNAHADFPMFPGVGDTQWKYLPSFILNLFSLV